MTKNRLAWIGSALAAVVLLAALVGGGGTQAAYGQSELFAGDSRQISWVQGTDELVMEFVWVPPGEFQTWSWAAYRNLVIIEQGFWMGKYPVTEDEWEWVMGSNPSHFTGCGRCPAQHIYNEVIKFIGLLNESEPSGSSIHWYVPSIYEWEWAAMAGTTGKRYGELDEIAWWGGNSGNRMHPVGGKRANAWGLHDMLGNYDELTFEWFDGESPIRLELYAAGGGYYSHPFHVTSGAHEQISSEARTAFRLAMTE